MKSIDEFSEEVLSILSDALDTSLELLGTVCKCFFWGIPYLIYFIVIKLRGGKK